MSVTTGKDRMDGQRCRINRVPSSEPHSIGCVLKKCGCVIIVRSDAKWHSES
jgi:hypothetical protein